MTGFNDDWYAAIIERFSPSSHTQYDAVDGLSRCILAAACILAQAIDGLADEFKSGLNDITEGK